jgi:hypothetical protein
MRLETNADPMLSPVFIMNSTTSSRRTRLAGAGGIRQKPESDRCARVSKCPTRQEAPADKASSRDRRHTRRADGSITCNSPTALTTPSMKAACNAFELPDRCHGLLAIATLRPRRVNVEASTRAASGPRAGPKPLSVRGR